MYAYFTFPKQASGPLEDGAGSFFEPHENQ